MNGNTNLTMLLPFSNTFHGSPVTQTFGALVTFVVSQMSLACSLAPALVDVVPLTGDTLPSATLLLGQLHLLILEANIPSNRPSTLLWPDHLPVPFLCFLRTL
jgi:hypothetical protein